MSEREINIVKRLNARHLQRRIFRGLLERYAGEVAVPCVAEPLMKLLKRGC